MPYGIFTDRMLGVVASHIAGRVVHDLGAGDCVLAITLLSSGAAAVEAVDKESLWSGIHLPPGGCYHQSAFVNYSPEAIDVAFVAWPENTRSVTTALLPLLQRAKTIVYLGKNTGGVMCGTPALFEHFAGRELLAYEPNRLNVLCVYGDPLGHQRAGAELRQEEVAGLTANQADALLDYSDT